MRRLSLEEQETNFVIEAANRDIVRVYSGDPVYQRKLERVGATFISESEDGGKFYELPANQLTIRKKPRPLSQAERDARAKRLKVAQMVRDSEAGKHTGS